MPTTPTKLNVDLVTKLAKLANNNPNENEANLAARKVCRLLAEADFKFTEASYSQPQSGQSNPYRRPTSRGDYYSADFSGINWDEVFRGVNERQTQRERYAEDSRRAAEEYEKRVKAEREAERKARANREADFRNGTWKNTYNPNDAKWSPYSGRPDYGSPIDWDDKANAPPKEPKWRTLQCKKCGHHKPTQFVGHSSQYMCINCIAKEQFDETHKKTYKPCKYCGKKHLTRMEPFVCNDCYQAYLKEDR
jgi:DNA-directed RNA polymerase subunit RPC12/RpoP